MTYEVSRFLWQMLLNWSSGVLECVGYDFSDVSEGSASYTFRVTHLRLPKRRGQFVMRRST